MLKEGQMNVITEREDEKKFLFTYVKVGFQKWDMVV